MTTQSTMAPQSSPTGIFIREIRIRNFRCLKSVDIELDHLTLLLGQNNGGKTSFLEAVFAAIGAGQRVLTEQDIFLKKGESAIPKSRSIAIDILIRPADVKGIVNAFPKGSPWLELWGSGVIQDDNDTDLAAIRTTFRWDAMKGEYVTERRFLKEWVMDSTKWESAKPVEKIPPLTLQQIEPLAIYMLDAKRDMVDDLRSRGSNWYKMVSEHGLSSTDIDRIEKSLSDINQQIVGSSAVLTHVEDHLAGFHGTIDCERESIAVTPLARHLRDLSRGMDIVLSTEGAPALSPGMHGMGTRSLGSILIFSAYMTWKQKQAKSKGIHPMTAVEEPECHLHPQAQRSLFRKLAALPGQKIISTHSPYIAGQGKVSQIRHFCKRGEESVVSTLDLGSGSRTLTPEDLRQIDRQVMNTRGDMLFARALVFFEGETEEQALPDFAERLWRHHPNDVGIGFIGVGGSGNYRPFLRMAKSFKIPWFVFSDGEPGPVKDLNSALSEISETNAHTNPRVLVLPNGQDFEAYIVDQCNNVDIVKAIVERRKKTPQHEMALAKEWQKKTQAELVEELRDHKTQYGAVLGKTMEVPERVKTLLDKINAEIGVVPLTKTA